MPNLRIYYVTNARMPTEKAHGYQIAKMCEAFADLGADVTLITPQRQNPIDRSVFEYYRVKNNFQNQSIPLFDWLTTERYLGRLSFYLLSLSFLWHCRKLDPPKDAIIYTRTPEIAWLFARRGYRTFFECHQLPEKRAKTFANLILRCIGITTSSHGMKEDMLKAMPDITREKVMVAPNGFDPAVFADPSLDKTAARQKLGLPLDQRVALYTGHLYAWKGVDTLARAAQELTDVMVYFVGGSDKDRGGFATKYPSANIQLIPFQPREQVALWLKAADVLILPNSPTNALSERHTSPIKLFEYMASGTPIIASDLPSIREILDDAKCFFFRPDDEHDLATKIRSVFNDQARAEIVAQAARAASQGYTWSHRAEMIADRLLH